MKKLLILLLILAGGWFFFFKDQFSLPTQLPLLKDDIHLSTDAKAMIMMDAEGKILYEKNSKEALPIASMSKMMTQYIVMNAIKNGTISWDHTYTPSQHVQEIVTQSSAVRLGMTDGNHYTVKELFTAMTVNSSNDAAVALAEMVSGTEDAFVHLMNEQAKVFGLKNTTFFNASGLDGDYIGKTVDETNIASARDVATIARHLIDKHPEMLDFTTLTDFRTSNDVQLWNTNLMLNGMPEAMSGIDGLKTGYTDLAGPCFTSTGIFNEKRVFTVVMDVAPDGEDYTTPKFQLTRELIEQVILN